MKLISDIIALPGWNTSMVMLLAKATLILIAALGITVAMQRASAGARHLVWLSTLGALLLVPALATFTPLRLEILPAREKVVEAPAQKSASLEQQSAAIRGAQPTSAPVTANAPTTSYVAPVTTTERQGFLARMSTFSLLAMVWGAVVFAILMSLLYGALMVKRIVRNSHPLDTQDWLTPLYEVSDRLELDEPPRLLSSSDAKMPFACGFLKPTIVLPAECESWSEDRRRAVLLHELAHVSRHDLVGHTLGRLACAVYWFHPLVWTAAKQLRNESERACDDLALSCGARASDYAEHLLDIVTSVRNDHTPVVALAMARRREFEGRMLAILDPELRHSKPSRVQSAALIASLAVITVVVGAAAPAHRPDKIVNGPVATINQTSKQTPSDFTPHDVAKPELSKSDKKDINEAASDALGNTLGGVVGDVINKTVQKTTENVVQQTNTNYFRNRVEHKVSSLDADGLAARAIARIGDQVYFLDKGSKGDKGGKGASGPDDRSALLANVLKTDTSAALRRVAAWGLSEYADDQIATDALVRALRSDADPSVREMAAWALAESDDRNSNATSALVGALKSDSKERVRETAAWALGNVGGRDAVEALTSVINDPNPSLRMRAVWAIGSIGPKSAPPALIATLKDSNPKMRELAAWALYSIEDPAAVPALNAALKSETSKDLQIDYIRALAALGDKSVDAVRELLLSSDPRIKSMAVRALAGGNAAGPWPWPWPEPRPYP
jgi:beta-lactamase regulating signal transducer with metallopeptidase domain/HEAT repeat protein